MKNKKWTDVELNKAIEYVKSGKTYDEISLLLDRTYSSVRVKLIKENEYRTKHINLKKDKIFKCLNCEKDFKSYYVKDRKFCCSSCSATYNNKIISKNIERNNKISESLKKFNSLNGTLNNRKDKIKSLKESHCLYCNNLISSSLSGNRKFCNRECHINYKNKIFYDRIENGDITLNYRRYKSYLIYKYGAKCMECGWEKVNSYTNRIPIEMEHIDGNSNNNSLDNLKLLCPSCHSLTKTYKGANIGNGRHNRRQRYKEGKSY